MRVTECLNQKPKDDGNWERHVVKQNQFFRALADITEDDFKQTTHHLIKWHEAFQKLFEEGQIDPDKFFTLNSQWKHAVKLFICARFVVQNNPKFPAALASEKDREWILNSLRKDFDEFSGRTPPLEVQHDEILMLCSLFADRTFSQSVIEIPFATAPATASEKGRIHLLELRKVRSFGLVQQTPFVFPFTDVYAKKIDSDFRMAIRTAFLLNQQPWEEEKLEDKFGPFGQYGIVWDVKPFYIEAEKEKLSDFQKRRIKDSTVEPDKEIQELLGRQPDRTLHGESIGLAALVGIHHVLRGKFPDERVLFSARLEQTQEGSNEVVRISGVDGIPQKIKAALETELIDTFVLHEGNFKQHPNGEKSAERQEIERLLKDQKDFRLKILASDGNETGAFPPIDESQTPWAA